MEFEVEFKLERGWTLAVGLLLGCVLGFTIFSRRDQLQQMGGSLADRSRHAIQAARARRSA